MFCAISDSLWIAVCIYLHTLGELNQEYVNELAGSVVEEFLQLYKAAPPAPPRRAAPLHSQGWGWSRGTLRAAARRGLRPAWPGSVCAGQAPGNDHPRASPAPSSRAPRKDFRSPP